MGIGEKIRNIRIHQGMTQKELGEKIGGISQQQIGRWENGKSNPKLESIQKIAFALDVSLFDIMSFEEFGDVIVARVEEQIEREIDEGKIIPIPNSLGSDYAKLNDIGKREAEKRVHELTEISYYIDKLE